MTSMGGRLGPRAITLAFFALVTVYQLWPLPARVREGFLLPWADLNLLALADCQLTTWMLSWGAHQLVTNPLRLFDANIFHPIPNALAFSEHILAGALLVLPLDLVHHEPILNHNVLVIVACVLSGTGTALVVRDLGGSLVPALLAGSLFALSPVRSDLVHVQALSTHWMPFVLLFLQRLLRTGRWRAAAGFALTFLLNCLSSVYYAYYLPLGVLAFLVCYAASRAPAAPRAHRRVLLAAAAAAFVLLPTFLPYLDARDRFGLSRPAWEAAFFSATGASYFGWFLDPVAQARARYVLGGGEALVGAGMYSLAAVGLAGGAIRGGRRIAGAYLAMATVAAVLSLGPVIRMKYFSESHWPGLHLLLAHILPGFEAMRVPARAAAVTALGLAVVAGLGADTLLRRCRRNAGRLAVLGTLSALVALDCWRPSFHFHAVDWATRVPAVYRWLAQRPGDFAIVELPLGAPQRDSLYMVMSTYHWKRLVNGYSSFGPALTYVADTLSRFPDEPSLRLLHDLGVRYVVVHRATASPAQRRLCDFAAEAAAASLAVAFSDASSCALELYGRAPAQPSSASIPVPLSDALLTADDGSRPSAAADGDLRSHWLRPMLTSRPTWLQIDLPTAHRLTEIVLRLGRHFGEYLRTYRVETSVDGTTWSTAADVFIAEAPLVDLLRSPDDLHQRIPLAGIEARHVRLLAPPRHPAPPTLLAGWVAWGVHELELYTTP
jgi:hypothetical protein